jgi:tetratricopeptide (TPR) repeat protein
MSRPTNQRRPFLILALGACLLAAFPAGMMAQTQAPDAQSPPPADPETSLKLDKAEGFHDLAVLYIRTREMDKALEAARQIIRLRLRADEQQRVAKSLSIITEKFAESRRYDLGMELLDEALRLPDLEPILPRLHRNKARLCMMAGDNECAIRHWRKALEIEERPVR